MKSVIADTGGFIMEVISQEKMNELLSAEKEERVSKAKEYLVNNGSFYRVANKLLITRLSKNEYLIYDDICGNRTKYTPNKNRSIFTCPMCGRELAYDEKFYYTTDNDLTVVSAIANKDGINSTIARLTLDVDDSSKDIVETETTFHSWERFIPGDCDYNKGLILNSFKITVSKFCNSWLFRPQANIESILKSKFPYMGEELYRITKAANLDLVELTSLIAMYISKPSAVENLAKCGYDKLIICGLKSKDSYKKFKMLFPEGRTLKDNFGSLPKILIDREVKSGRGVSLATLDEWRKLSKNTEITYDVVKRFENINLDSKTMKSFRMLITKGHYSFLSLVNYLYRADMYQGINFGTTVEILTDYIRMCKDMNVTPDYNTNSLKKSHDVMMRNYRYVSDTRTDLMFKNICAEYGSKFDYTDGTYCVISPKETIDLVKESQKMNNCTASYINEVAKGNSIILFGRRNETVDEPFVTIEMSPDSYTINQKYLAGNMAISDRTLLEFFKQYQERLYKIKERENEKKTEIA